MANNRSTNKIKTKTPIKSGGFKSAKSKKIKLIFIGLAVFVTLGLISHRLITGDWIGANAATTLNYNPYYSRCNPEIRNTRSFKEGDKDSTNLDTGYCVKVIQRALNACCGQGLLEDGVFGPKTKQAVINYQTFFKDPNPDGIVDKDSWGGMDYVHSLTVTNSGQKWIEPITIWQQALTARSTTSSTSGGSTSTNTTNTQTPGSTTTSTGTAAGTVGPTNTTNTQTPGSTTTSTGTAAGNPSVPPPAKVKELTECVKYTDTSSGSTIVRASPSDTYRASAQRNGCYQISNNLMVACFKLYKLVNNKESYCTLASYSNLLNPPSYPTGYKVWTIPKYIEKNECDVIPEIVVGTYVLNNIEYKGYPSWSSFGCHKGKSGAGSGDPTTELVKCLYNRTPHKRTQYINGRAVSDYKCIYL